MLQLWWVDETGCIETGDWSLVKRASCFLLACAYCFVLPDSRVSSCSLADRHCCIMTSEQTYLGHTHVQNQDFSV